MAGFSRALVLTLAACGLLLGASSGARAGDGWWGDLDKGQSVRLSDVMSSPEAFRGRVLTFTCVFHRPEREFNPLRTRFNAERYDNVSVWPDGRALWLEADYEQDFPFLYVARTHAQHHDLMRQETFTRLEVTGRIEAVLDGYPFVELTSFRVTGHRLGKQVVDLMTRVETFARSRDTEAQGLALDNARAALDGTPDLAPLYAVRIRARLAELLRAQGRTSEAEAVLRGEGAGEAPRGPTPQLPPPADPTGGPVADPPLPRVNLPGEPTDTPAPPRGGNLPGTPADTPAPPRGGNLPGTPDDGVAQPAPRLPPEPPPAVLPGPVPPTRTEPFRPSLPGVPMDTPAPPVRSEPRAGAAPESGVVPVPPTVAQPEVVDPPLPPPPRNGAPPPRKPRLAGVK